MNITGAKWIPISQYYLFLLLNVVKVMAQSDEIWKNWENVEPEVKLKRWSRSGLCDHDALNSVLLRIILDIQDAMTGGNPAIGVPHLDPLILMKIPVDTIRVNDMYGIKGEFTNTVIRGLSTFSISDIQSNYDTLEANVTVEIDAIMIRGDYKLRGVIRSPIPLPIIGNGKFLAFPKLTTLDFYTKFGYNPKGELELRKFDFDINVGDLFVKFDGIWGGGRVLTSILKFFGLKAANRMDPIIHEKLRSGGFNEINSILADLKYDESWMTEMLDIPLRCFFG